jgi:hypothetical protein
VPVRRSMAAMPCAVWLARRSDRTLISASVAGDLTAEVPESCVTTGRRSIPAPGISSAAKPRSTQKLAQRQAPRARAVI